MSSCPCSTDSSECEHNIPRLVHRFSYPQPNAADCVISNTAAAAPETLQRDWIKAGNQYVKVTSGTTLHKGQMFKSIPTTNWKETDSWFDHIKFWCQRQKVKSDNQEQNTKSHFHFSRSTPHVDLMFTDHLRMINPIIAKWQPNKMDKMPKLDVFI